MTVPSYTVPCINVVPYNSVTKAVNPESGRGFGLRGEIKPDLAVPGINIPTILGRRSGSSFAAALAGGGVAQLLQWAVVEENDVSVDSNDIRSYLIRGATREKEIVYPNEIWGYGIYNLVGVFNFLSTIR